MCGILAVLGHGAPVAAAGIDVMEHRGPDDRGVLALDEAELGHLRLSIVDLSADGHQPMTSADDRYAIVFNGEIYNYRELREELRSYPFRTKTDTEVILAAFDRWGEACLDHLIGMFAFVIWDHHEHRAFAARDRFGVKPLYRATLPDGRVVLASEVKACHAVGVPSTIDETAWATYLSFGAHDHSTRTFWAGITAVPPGHAVRWRSGVTQVFPWYDVASRISPAFDARPEPEVEREYLHLLLESVKLRFRADVPVGINLSGGLDSSTLLAAVQQVQGADSDIKAFTFVCNDPGYDELPWVEEMLAMTNHPLVIATLSPDEVPELAASVFQVQDEPYGGIPTLAYARLFETARAAGVTVLLDGQGLDEQWAGYDYYRSIGSARSAALIQGVSSSPVRPKCLEPEFAALAEAPVYEEPFPDALRNAQYRDIRYTKLQRALRFNDRVSMRSSRELREPFLDHRLVELALSQSAHRKVGEGTGKVLLRKMVGTRLPAKVVTAPKRPLQTPQREWLRGPLMEWNRALVDAALTTFPSWFAESELRAELDSFLVGEGDSSFHVWQWIGVGLLATAGR